MLGEDHACVWPMIGYGMVPFTPSDYEKAGPELFGGAGNLEYNLFIKDADKAKSFFRDTVSEIAGNDIPRHHDRAAGDGEFIPEAVLIYARPTHLRSLRWR
jgi:hypothetical protein